MSTLDDGRRKSGQSPAAVGDVGPKTDGRGRRQLYGRRAGHRVGRPPPPRPFLLEAARAMKVANGGSRRASPSPLLRQAVGQTVIRRRRRRQWPGWSVCQLALSPSDNDGDDHDHKVRRRVAAPPFSVRHLRSARSFLGHIFLKLKRRCVE